MEQDNYAPEYCTCILYIQAIGYRNMKHKNKMFPAHKQPDTETWNPETGYLNPQVT